MIDADHAKDVVPLTFLVLSALIRMVLSKMKNEKCLPLHSDIGQYNLVLVVGHLDK